MRCSEIDEFAHGGLKATSDNINEWFTENGLWQIFSSFTETVLLGLLFFVKVLFWDGYVCTRHRNSLKATHGYLTF